jgi:DNA repair protein RadC
MKSYKLNLASDPELIEERYNLRDMDLFSSLLSYAKLKDPELIARQLLQRYRTIENAVSADVSELSGLLGERAATFVKLLGYLTSRRGTDMLTFGRFYSPSEISDYLKALFIGESVEKVYLLSFDSEERLLSCDFVASGTAGASDVLPRMLMETALKSGAVSVALAHNHPFGEAVMSADDINLTAKMSAAFREIGVSLVSHYVVAGQRVCYVNRFSEELVTG